MENTKKYNELVMLIEKKKKILCALLDENILNSASNLKLSQEIDELIVRLYKEQYSKQIITSS